METSIEKYLTEAEAVELAAHGAALEYLNNLQAFAERALPESVLSEKCSALLQYRVPAMSADGCSRIDGTMDDAPYDLRPTLGLPDRSVESHPAVCRLAQIDSLVEKVAAEAGIDWLGVYLAWKSCDGSDALVKLAYRGAESRAEFPLTREFARQSNNSTVGLSGKAVVINDIEQYLWDQGGPYYQCDSKVLSEACLPIFKPGGDGILGIVDAEAWSRGTFSPEVISKLTAFCVVLESALDNLVAELK
ncbi:MAG: hypothetical protein KDD66_15545 [Bdellovibrionales bacterium]|nr:hypothetical protein [Bdellovibrionales bacterium]